jgi:hypothetical protein
MRFDIILGNPPYNGGPSKNRPIYHIFVEKSLSLLKNTGYSIIITPQTWMFSNKSSFGKYRQYLKTRGLESITIKDEGTFSNVNIGKFSIIKINSLINTPNISIFTSNQNPFYIVKDNSTNKIRFEREEIGTLFEKILTQMIEMGWIKFNVIRGKLFNIPRTYKSESFINRNNITIFQNKDINHPNPILDTGNRITYTSYDDITSLNKKIWFPMRGSITTVGKVRYDEGGNIFSQGLVYFEVKDKTEADIITQYLNTSIARFMIKYVKGGQSCNILNNIRHLYVPISDWDIGDFNLTPEEIELIEQ